MSVKIFNKEFIPFNNEYEDNKFPSEKFYTSTISSIFDITEDIVLFFNSQFNLVYANNSFLKLFGYSKNEIFGKHFTYFFFSKDLLNDKKKLLKELKNSVDEKSIYLGRKKGGSSIKCSFKRSILKNELENDFIIQLIGNPVYDDKTVQSQFLFNSSKLSEILKSFVDYLFVIDINGNILDFVSEEDNTLISDVENPVGKKIQEVLLVDNTIRKKVVRSIFKAVLKNSCETMEIYDPQTLRIYQIKITPSDENYFLILIKDVTSLKESISEKNNLENIFKQMWENSQDGLILLDSGGCVIDANSSLCRIFSFKDREEVIGKNFVELFYPNEKRKDEILNKYIKYFKNKTFFGYQELELTIRTGEIKSFNITFSFSEIKEENKYSFRNQPYLLCIFKDITQSKMQAQALKLKEEMYYNFINTSSDAIVMTDLNGKILNVNNRGLDLFKYELIDEIVSKNIHDFISSDQKQLANIIFHKIIAKGSSVKEEFCLYNKEGAIFNGDVNISSIFNKDNKPYALMIFIKDITKQKKLEKELDNTKFFATIGKMASYISHQIKTPLSAIKMNIDMLRPQLTMNESEKKSFEIISKEIKRLSDITKNILMFSKDSEPKFDQVDLFQVIESIIFLLNPLLNTKGITLKNKLRDVKVRGDLVLLQSIFLLLLENSIDAIEKDGLIEIYSKINRNKGFYSIFIKDSGCGIADKEKIFEPFYTTKSSGTGLGVPIAERILKQHNGSLNLVSSKKGETIFEIKINKFDNN